MGATNLLRKYLVTEAQTTRCLQASETLCRKGGTSRSDNAPRASGACAGAKLACGATLSATREFGLLLRSYSNVPTASETPSKPAERNVWPSRGHIWSRARADIKLLILILITYLICIEGFKC